MQDKTTQVLINELTKVFSQSFEDFKGVYLYGSRAKGDFQPDSDYDIVAIFDEMNQDKRFEIWKIIGPIEAKKDVFLDLHPMTIKELEQNYVYHDQVVNKGVYYAA